MICIKKTDNWNLDRRPRNNRVNYNNTLNQWKDRLRTQLLVKALVQCPILRQNHQQYKVYKDKK